MKRYVQLNLLKFKLGLKRKELIKYKLFCAQQNKKRSSFDTFFKNTNYKPNDDLWNSFLKWEQGNQFQSFLQHCRTNEKIAETEVNSFPNPLKNAKQGEEYACSFILPSCIKHCVFSGIEDSGLTFSQNGGQPIKCMLSGIPLKSGDFNITMCYEYNGWLKGMPSLTRKFTLTILPDPQTLWKNIPTNPAIEYYTPDHESFLQPGDMEQKGKKLLAASLRGRSHAHKGLPRDDHFLVCHDADSDWYVLSVADGAGSAKFSRAGSQLACETAIQSCLQYIKKENSFENILKQLVQDRNNESLKAQAIRIAYNILPKAALDATIAIREEAAEKNRDIKEYSTTLLFCICKQLDHGWAVLSFGIGDGAMGMISDNGKLNLLHKPDEGEFSGQTCFITMQNLFKNSADLFRRIHICVVDDFDAVILMTDGVSDAKFETEVNLQNPLKWKSLWNELQEIRQNNPEEFLLKWLSFWSPGNHDDRTIAIMY